MSDVMLSTRIPLDLKQRLLGLVAAERVRKPSTTLRSVVEGALLRELARAKRRRLDVKPMRVRSREGHVTRGEVA